MQINSWPWGIYSSIAVVVLCLASNPLATSGCERIWDLWSFETKVYVEKRVQWVRQFRHPKSFFHRILMTVMSPRKHVYRLFRRLRGNFRSQIDHSNRASCRANLNASAVVINIHSEVYSIFFSCFCGIIIDRGLLHTSCGFNCQYFPFSINHHRSPPDRNTAHCLPGSQQQSRRRHKFVYSGFWVQNLYLSRLFPRRIAKRTRFIANDDGSGGVRYWYLTSGLGMC